ncbi:Gfo/Idh/MocA family protein [Allorhodopirellula heiligendammensis]|uniref:4-carboxy-2-hydroxymuconate-6-semialdehyde dehydrogenase n=1 Tax=Allorhodopirellula heiligendammensis TaxID=2714739 RepID=A0A5C6C822_9BACT|nr:Gfo/Idh/MocA family oxidoreductase [Allorhodopirellula heiligendammensis]TWU19464.1 4-carboxy-2-hydroxymuconate-6-semialdehyde dehydrogenase [Allorhodopirellula heiligendammensis]
MAISPPARSTRRQFLKTTSTVGGSLIIMGTKATAGIRGANDRVRIAVAGLSGRGQSHIDGWSKAENVEIAYVIDPAANVLQSRLRGLEKRSEGKLATAGVADFREALDDKNLDAISVATPNHWHSLITIKAAQAGKHVYVEKPMSHDVAEGRVAVEAQKKYGVVVQHGTQRRSSAGIAGLHEALKSGELPRLKIAYGYCCKPRSGIGTKPAGRPPADLNWDLWKGPAVIDQYHGNYHPYNWHWFWETGNGDLNNQGTHQLDVARWAIDDDQTHPVRAMSIGGRFAWDDQGETPNTMFSFAEYPNGQMVFFNVRNVNYKGYQNQVFNEYYLEDGSVITGEGNYQIRRPGAKQAEKLKLSPGHVTPGGNWNSFISAVRAADPSMANGNVMDAHYGCVLGHLMNNSYRLGEPTPFNADAGKLLGNADAEDHFGRLHAIMRDGVGISDGSTQYQLGKHLTFDPTTERFTGDFADAANSLIKDDDRPGFEIPGLEAV